MPLALILPRGDQLYLLRKPLIRRDKGNTISLLARFFHKPCVAYASLPASLLFSSFSGSVAIESTLSRLCFLFYFHPAKSSPFPTSFIQFLWGFLSFFAPPPPSPILPLASRPWALLMVLSVIWRSRLGIESCGGLGLLVTTNSWRCPPSRVFTS